MTVPGSFPKMWRSWGDGKKIVAILDLSLFYLVKVLPVLPHTSLIQFEGSPCHEERTTTPRSRIDLHYDAEIQYWMHFLISTRGGRTFSVPSRRAVAGGLPAFI